MRVEWQVPPALQNVTLGRPVAKPLTRVVDVIEEGQAMQHCASRHLAVSASQVALMVSIRLACSGRRQATALLVH